MTASVSPSADGGVSIGSVLDGRYRIDAILGSGGMGRVYRGEHTGIGRAVAIKVLHAALNRNREASARFQREAIASGRLDHPNIVSVSDFGVLDDGACYLVMEVLEGESLGTRLEKERRVEWRAALDILRGVLLGLRHAHERGVVHRDIKPDNVFLARKDGEVVVKILDFGIAKLYAGSADDPASTRAGLTVGTPAYLSPEQAVGGEITPASDLYSATIVLFEMLAGRAPFEDKDPLAMLGAHVGRPPPTIRELAPQVEIPDGLEELIQRGLVKQSAERISSATEYLARLEEIIAGAPAAARGSSATSTSSSSLPADLLGVAQTASFTPVPSAPGTRATPVHPMTPPPGLRRTPVPAEFGDQSIIMTVTPGDPMYTPVPGGYPTPSPGTLAQHLSATASSRSMTPMPRTPMPFETAGVPQQTRGGVLAELGDAIPRRWLHVGGLVVAAFIVFAIVLSLAGRDDKATPPRAGAAPEPTALPLAVPGLDVALDHDMQLKAALHDLQEGKTCAARKAAIPMLVELRDPRAIQPLKSARYRMRGGLVGIGDENTNHCLKASAEAALKVLSPPKAGSVK